MAISGKVAVTAKAGLTHDAGIRDRILSTKTKADPIFNKDKKFNRNSNDTCTGCGKKGRELNNFGTVFIEGVPNTCTVLTENPNKQQNQQMLSKCSTSTKKCFSIQIFIQGQEKVGLVDSGSSVSLISVELLKAIGDTKRIDPYSKTSVKILGIVELLVQIKPKQPK